MVGASDELEHMDDLALGGFMTFKQYFSHTRSVKG